MKGAWRCVQALYGLTFLAAGLLKVQDPESFQAALELYRLLPSAANSALARTLPPLEILLGLALLTGWGAQGALLWAELLLYAFSAAMASVKLRGLEIDCGCLGPGFDGLISWKHCLIALLGAIALSLGRRTGAAATKAAAAD